MSLKNQSVIVLAIFVALLSIRGAHAQSFTSTQLDFGGIASVSAGTSLEFGPDGRLYVLQLNGTIDVLTIERTPEGNYGVIEAEELLHLRGIPNHNDDGTSHSSVNREATGIAVAGTTTNPIVYATSSDSRVGGPSGDKDLDTNSGVLTRIEWHGSDLDDPEGHWVAVDLVRGLPRSEENHATNGLDPISIAGMDYLVIAQGGHANAGAPSGNFAWSTEYALSAAVLAINLTQLEALPILNDGARDYIYDLPTVDDPTRPNANGIEDPSDPQYDGIDVSDPWGGNDGLNQARIVPGGPVQIFSPGYRNAYDVVVTESGAVYVTDNGANGGWGGFPENEGLDGNVTNNYRVGEPGSTGADPDHGDATVNNLDHLTLITLDAETYVFGSFYGGHPTPIRANPAGAGLFARGSHSSDPDDLNGNSYHDDWFRTVPYDPTSSGDAADPMRALPADWPPVPVEQANPIEGDFRAPGGPNPDGPIDQLVTTWANNTNGIDEYTASNFGGAMRGNLIAGSSGGRLHRVELDANGNLVELTESWASNLGGNPLGVTANSDDDPFPGTIWVATFNANIVVLEPQDFGDCPLPGDAEYDAFADNDLDGYTNQDEFDNDTDPCHGGSQPGDFDKRSGGPLVSDLNDADDDDDGIPDSDDPLQLGDPLSPGSDAFSLPVVNELFSDNLELGGYLGLGLTGMMNNGAPNPNWSDWIDRPGNGPNPNDVLGGAVGAVTMQMTSGTAVGDSNDQDKAFQYGVHVDTLVGGFRIESRMLNFGAGLQLFPFVGPGELGIFMGDGTQSNFVQFTLSADGVSVLDEANDAPLVVLSQAITPSDRPNASLTFRLDVDSATGQVAAYYSKDDGEWVSIGSFAARGTVLDAIQLSDQPLMVGLIGSSHTPDAEVEGTWDYLSVVGQQPTVELPLPSFEQPIGSAGISLDLDDHFSDDDGDSSLVYTVVANSDPSVQVQIDEQFMNVVLPDFATTSVIVIRATDGNGLFVEQSFTITVTAASVIYRLNAGGETIAAIDGGLPWSADEGSLYLVDSGSGETAGFSITEFSPQVDLDTTPIEIFMSERWDRGTGLPRIKYEFPVAAAGHYEVRLYMGNGWAGTSSPGQRIFDVDIEGVRYSDLTDLDLVARFGPTTGGVITHAVEVTDGLLEIEYFHGSVNNPLLNGIEILEGVGAPSAAPIAIAPLGSQLSGEGATVTLPVIASGGDTPSSYFFAADGLPAGLQIEATSGLIFGEVATAAHEASPYSVTVVVDDNDDDDTDSVSTTFTWIVTDPDALHWIDKDESEDYTARHECSFCQAGNKFYLFGGRESPETLDTYDYTSNTWTTSASAPLPFNHFQATEFEGLVWVVGAFKTNNYPSEIPADHVWVFDPANNAWTQGPEVPVDRRRGSAGLGVYNDRFYVVGGNIDGHDGGYVPWFDEFDPQTGNWTPLEDAPRPRDHFHAAVLGDALYVAGGRLSGGPGGTFAPLVAEVDVYDFTTGQWSTLPSASDIPTPRAGSAVAVRDDKLLVIGGEGDGQAYDTVEAFDPSTGEWEVLSSLNYPRHGTQAVVSGGNVYVTAGSPQMGNGNQKNMEVYGVDAPEGEASVAGLLELTSTGDIVDGEPTSIALHHTDGNQGVFVSDVVVSGPDAAEFAIAPTRPFLLPVGGTVEIAVQHVGTSSTAVASIDFVTAGGHVSSIEVQAVSASPPDFPLVTGTVVVGSSWTTVTLDRSFVLPVVVATPQYVKGAPLVTRVRNAGGSTFELRVQRTDGQTDAVDPVKVHFLVAESGLHDLPEFGLRFEAVRFNSTVTDNASSWVGEFRTYQQKYSQPVVLGQVMSDNGEWSSFWSRGVTRTDPASPKMLYVGKHMGEEPKPSRAEEVIGYLVIEAGAGVLPNAVPWEAKVGNDSVGGFGSSPSYSYPVQVAELTSAVACSAGMDGGNGGWPILFCDGPLSPNEISLAIDEDQILDAERAHTNEQVSYFAVGTASALSVASQ